MTSRARQDALTEIDNGMTDLLRAGAEGDEAARECAIADLLMCAKTAIRLVEEMATQPREAALAIDTERMIAEAEAIVTGTAVGA